MGVYRIKLEIGNEVVESEIEFRVRCVVCQKGKEVNVWKVQKRLVNKNNEESFWLWLKRFNESVKRTFIFMDLEKKAIPHIFYREILKEKEGKKSMKGTRGKKVFWKW